MTNDNIRIKSVGFLLDEYFTSVLKVHHFDDRKSKDRMNKLIQALKDYDFSSTSKMDYLYKELKNTNKRCWNAQETIMNSDDVSVVYLAAKDAQRLNKQRNKLIRDIDRELGEENISPLEKTYE